MSLRNAGIQNIGVFLRGGLSWALAQATGTTEPGRGFFYEGTVVDADCQPIVGARVALIGTALAASADRAGTFRLGDAVQVEGDPGRESPPPLYPLEFSAEGYQAETVVPDSSRMAGMAVALDRLPYGAEGEQADLAPYAYTYRKGAANNPSETRWLEPTDDMLCGLLWEEKPLIDRVEVEFADGSGTIPAAKGLTLNVLSGGLYPRRVHPTETINWYARDKASLRSPLECLESHRTDRRTTIFTFGHDPLGRPVNFIFKGIVRPRRDHPVQALSLHYHGDNKATAVPAIRAYGPGLWAKPRTLDVEWGFMGDTPRAAVNGWIESQCASVAKIEPLEPGNGATVVGEHHWREHNETSGRRGIRVTVFPIAGPQYHRTAVNFYATDVLGGAYDEITTIQPSASVTLWTSIGSVTFAVDDLERGPILIPSVGLFIAPADSGITGRQFQARLAAETRNTVRQQVREHAEQTYIGAMLGVFGDAARELPPFPEPPYESPMQIDVPEKALVGQWRLGAWHLKRWSRQIADNIYAISIWPYRTAENTPTCIAAETQQIIKTFDLMGMHDVAEGGLNYWLSAKEYAAGGNEGGGYGNYFSDFDGVLLTNDYDMRHVTGHGQILQVAVLHYRVTGNRAWVKDNATRLRKACEWIVRQRRQWNAHTSPNSWSFGMFPPSGIGDGYGMDAWFIVNAEYCLGLRSAADMLFENGVEGATELREEAERYRQDIRAAAQRSAALSPVIALGDGTYRRYIPPAVNTREGTIGWHKEMTAGAMWLVGEDRIFEANEPIAQGLLDVVEEVLQAGDTRAPDWLNKGGTGSQTGWERHKALYLLCDDVAPFLRALYNAYAGDIRPWENKEQGPHYSFHDGRLSGGTIAGREPAYTFSEHPQGGTPDKTHGEAVFLEHVRNMLVMEVGEALWLARATPRHWLEQGKRIGVNNAPTRFGQIAYQIVSDVDNGEINATVEMPSRKPPKDVILRFRHPKSAAMESVTVNGKPWTQFDKEKETVALGGLTGTIRVTAQYRLW